MTAVPACRRVALFVMAAGVLLACSCRAAPKATAPHRAFVDGIGRSVLIPIRPDRVVSLAPSVTEAIYELGFGDRLVGVSDFCKLPDGARAVARVGGILNPSLEAIRALHPDLLIATTSGNDPALPSQAEALGVPLYTIQTPDIRATLQALEALADLMGDPARGARLASDLRRRLEAVRTRVAPLRAARVLYIVWGDPLIVPGRPAFLTDALRAAGAASVTAEAASAWPTYDLESAIRSAPEVIVTSERNRGMAERLLRDPAWARVPAVRSRRVLVVSESIEQPGPQVIRGIEELASRLYPEAFGREAGGAGEKN
ncbi:MAG TPA: helical backbone metal receptor [Candidatus Polarisedimenticolia bacterium]